MSAAADRRVGLVLVIAGAAAIAGYLVFLKKPGEDTLKLELRSPDVAVRTRAVERAKKLGPEETKAITELLDSPVEREAVTAVHVLEQANTPEARHLLAAAIETRAAGPEAVRALVRLRDATAIPSLTEALQSSSPGDRIRYEITKALGEIGDKQVIPTLEGFLRNRRPPSGAWMKGSSVRENAARVNAIASLARLDPENEIARDSVFELWAMIRVGPMSPESDALQLEALRTLALIPTEDALEVVRRTFDHETPDVQAEAIRVFAKKNPPDRRKVLQELAERGLSEDARETAKALLASQPVPEKTPQKE